MASREKGKFFFKFRAQFLEGTFHVPIFDPASTSAIFFQYPLTRHRNRRLNEYSTKNGASKTFGGGASPQKPRMPKLRRMSAAAFNFLSHNIAPKWLTDRLNDDGASDKREWDDNPKHRLSLNDDHYHGYGSTQNGGIAINGHANGKRKLSYAPVLASLPSGEASSAPADTEQRRRRLSSPDPVLTHCANTIAVADFLMTLQRSLDKSSATVQPGVRGPGHGHQHHHYHHERRSPLFTLFQDRRGSSSVDSWQYSSLASTTSTDTAAGALATMSSSVQHTALTIDAVTIHQYVSHALFANPRPRPSYPEKKGKSR